jgi:hypothetical protein
MQTRNQAKQIYALPLPDPPQQKDPTTPLSETLFYKLYADDLVFSVHDEDLDTLIECLETVAK